MNPKLRAASAALLVSALVALTVALPTAPAQAAVAGPGYSYQGDPHSHLGGFVNPDGSIGYCIDAGKGSPVGGVTTDAGVVERIHGRSDAIMLQLSWVLGRYGNTRDDDVAAAVALVVWGLADPSDHAARGGDGFVITRAPADRRGIILALADRFRAEAAAFRRPQPGTAGLSLTSVPGDPARAVLDVELDPVAATGSLTLVNGVFSDTGLPTRDDVADGQQLQIDAVAPPGGADYTLDVAGAFTRPGHPDGSVHVYSTPGAQTIAAAGRRVPIPFVGEAHLAVIVPRPVPELPRVAG